MRKFKQLFAAVFVAVFTFMLTGCSYSGNPPKVSAGDIICAINESSPAVFLEDGFELSFAYNNEVKGSLPKRSWLRDFIYLKKDSKIYALLDVYNPSLETVDYQDAVIYRIQIYMHSEDEQSWAEDNLLVNGINYCGMDKEAVKETMSEFKIDRERDTSVRYKDGFYTYIFSFDADTNVIKRIEITYELSKDYD